MKGSCENRPSVPVGWSGLIVRTCVEIKFGTPSMATLAKWSCGDVADVFRLRRGVYPGFDGENMDQA